MACLEGPCRTSLVDALISTESRKEAMPDPSKADKLHAPWVVLKIQSRMKLASMIDLI